MKRKKERRVTSSGTDDKKENEATARRGRSLQRCWQGDREVGHPVRTGTKPGLTRLHITHTHPQQKRGYIERRDQQQQQQLNGQANLEQRRSYRSERGEKGREEEGEDRHRSRLDLPAILLPVEFLSLFFFTQCEKKEKERERERRTQSLMHVLTPKVTEAQPKHVYHRQSERETCSSHVHPVPLSPPFSVLLRKLVSSRLPHCHSSVLRRSGCLSFFFSFGRRPKRFATCESRKVRVRRLLKRKKAACLSPSSFFPPPLPSLRPAHAPPRVPTHVLVIPPPPTPHT